MVGGGHLREGDLLGDKVFPIHLVGGPRDGESLEGNGMDGWWPSRIRNAEGWYEASALWTETGHWFWRPYSEQVSGRVSGKWSYPAVVRTRRHASATE